MNTANLQLEGLLLALASLLQAFEHKGLLTREEIDAMLGEAEARARSEPQRPSELSAANVDAVCFPIRFLRLAATRPERPQGFAEITASVGHTKPEH